MFDVTASMSANRTAPTPLPPTLGIVDVAMRQWAEAMTSAWSVRNGGGGPESEQFVRKGEVGLAAESAVMQVIGQAFGATAAPGTQLGISNVQAVIDEVLASKVVEYLRTPLDQIAIPTAKLNALSTRISQESTIRENGDASLASLITTVSAGSGAFEPFQKWEFDSTTEGWAAIGATITAPGEYLSVSSTSVDPRIFSPAISINGAANDKVRMRLRRIGGASWDGTIFYTTPGHGETAAFRKAVAAPNFIGSDWLIAEWDMAALTQGGTDWSSSTVSRIRIDLGNAADDVFDVDWIAIGKRGVGVSSASVVQEITTRSNKDNALAQAINTVWASVGGSSALIQDGALASISPAAVAATKWLQVQAAVTDPNTGLVNAVSIKQELNAYASNANNTFNASYGLRLNVNGAISGFSLMASAGAGSAPGVASSSFAILADRLSLVSPTNARVLPFTVDGLGNAVFAGWIYAAGGTFAGALNAATGTFSGSLSAASGSFTGSLSAATGTFSGSLTAATGTFAGTLTAGALIVAGQSIFSPAAAEAFGAVSVGPGWMQILGPTAYVYPGGTGAVQIVICCDWYTGWSTTGGETDFTSYSPPSFRLKRNATVINSWTPRAGSLAQTMAVTFIDSPGGSATYTLEAISGFGLSSLPQVIHRTMTAIGVIR